MIKLNHITTQITSPIWVYCSQIPCYIWYLSKVQDFATEKLRTQSGRVQCRTTKRKALSYFENKGISVCLSHARTMAGSDMCFFFTHKDLRNSPKQYQLINGLNSLQQVQFLQQRNHRSVMTLAWFGHFPWLEFMRSFLPSR